MNYKIIRSRKLHELSSLSMTVTLENDLSVQSPRFALRIRNFIRRTRKTEHKCQSLNRQHKSEIDSKGPSLYLLHQQV